MSMEATTLALYGHLLVQVMDLLFLNIVSTTYFKNKKQNYSVTWDFYVTEVWYKRVKYNIDSPVMTVQRHRNSCVLICDLDLVPSALRKSIYSHALQLPKGKNKQNKTPEMTYYKPPWHSGISACSVKCQSS